MFDDVASGYEQGSFALSRLKFEAFSVAKKAKPTDSMVKRLRREHG